ncbi:hypothetical protein ABEY41_01155 [Peribacillus butanolivorans]|uniref:hypothetical protein n=1 Tax=Peribacillus butanolivorans TaxID=421767 RepID=UPI003D28A779
MSFNAIEMQIALSRTQDAGKIQEQNQQKKFNPTRSCCPSSSRESRTETKDCSK